MSKNTAIWACLMVGAVFSLLANKFEAAVICIAAAFVVAAIDDAIEKLRK